MNEQLLDHLADLRLRLTLKLRRLDPRWRARQRATAEQVRVPYPPYVFRSEPGFDRRPRHAEEPESSYTSNRVRLWTPSGQFDLEPSGRGGARPRDIGLASPLVIMSGFCPPGRRSTAVDNAVSVARFGDELAGLLGHHGVAGAPSRAVLFPAGREWVEIGAGFSGVPLEEVREFAVARGLSGFLLWQDDRIRFEWADGDGPSFPVPVGARPVRPGCPMRTCRTGRRCVPQGGPWIAASQRCALFWTAHQRMLIDAFGCGVVRR